MQKIFKAVLRDIWHHKYRSLITFFALFAIIAFPLGMFSTSPNISRSIQTNNDEYKLSHLDLRFTNGNESLIPLINTSIYDTLNRYPDFIESRLIAQGKSKIGEENPTWEATTLVGIPKSVNQSTNRFSIESGNSSLSDNEVYVIDSFAEAFDLSIGSNLTVFIGASEINLTIAGLVRSVEYLSYNLNQGCIVYIDTELLHSLVGLPNTIVNGITIYFWEDVTSEELSDAAKEIRDVFEVEGVYLAFQWQMREISVSAVLKDALEIASRYLNAASLIIIIVVGIVVFIITKRYALEQRKQTGTLYAFGFNSSKILQAFLLRTLILCVLAMILGTFGGYGLLRIITQILVGRWGIINVIPSLSPIILAIILSSTLVISILFTWLAAKSNVNLTPYEAIRGRVKGYSGTRLNFMSNWKNTFKYPIRNLFRNKGRSFLTFLAFAGSIMLAFSLIVTKSSVYTTKDVYFSEQVNWDVKTVFLPGYNPTTYTTLSNISGVTDFEPYLEMVVQSEDYLDSLVYLRGLDPNTNLSRIDIQSGNSFSNSTASEIIMSIFVADRMGLSVGDTLSFTLLGYDINTTIVGLCRDLELVFSMYIQLSTLEDILGFSPHNGMLLKVDSSEKNAVIEELNNHEEVAFALSKEKFETRIFNLFQTITIIVNVMVFLGFLVSFITIFATSFISSLEREREYAVLRVFGYTSANILGQLLFEIFILCIFAMVLGLTTGNLLSIYWNSIISSLFFTIDLYAVWNNYLYSGGFALITIVISIFPAFRLIIRQKLAEQINEE